MKNNNQTLKQKKAKLEYQKQYYQIHREEIAKKAKEYYQAHKEERKKYYKKRHLLHKEKISKQNKQYYLINREKILKREKEYRQTHREYRRQYHKEHSPKNPSVIYNILKNNSIRENRECKISKEKFIDWWSNKEQKCYYCGITLEELSKIKDTTNNGVRRLTVDRMDNNKGYTLDNITLACKRCNTIKSNFFTSEEMKEIGEKYVRPKWEKQLKENKGG